MRPKKLEITRIMIAASIAALLFLAGQADADERAVDRDDVLLQELSSPLRTQVEELEKLVAKGSRKHARHGFATYYASKFNGRNTASGHRYHPDKMTAAHQSLPFGTVVRVLNPANNLDVHVTINDRCAPKRYHFIDLSRAAAKKIGLWGKGRIKVVIIPLIEESPPKNV